MNRKGGTGMDMRGEDGRHFRRLACTAVILTATATFPAAVGAQNPGDTFRDCEECPEMVAVPAGSFMMGSPETEEGRHESEGPVRPVRIEEGIAVGVYEVTFAEWDACESGGGCGGYRPGDEGWGRGLRPVINVSWQDAQAYVDWLSSRTGKRYRLLSEAEWEYVARAGTTGRYHFGETISPESANYGKRRNTVPVGSYSSNAFGLYDVHGNVWEWVEDCWEDDYEGAPETQSPWESGRCSRRVLRSGSWDYKPEEIRSAYRDSAEVEERDDDIGFRVARTLD